MTAQTRLNPTQRRTLATLGAGDADARPEFAPDLGDRLRARLEADLGPVAETIGSGTPLGVTKHLLNGVHGCQARYLHDEARPFEPSIPIVRGTIVHKALELGIHWQGVPTPLELVDTAIERTATTDHWATEFVAELDPAGRAELRAGCAAQVAAFLETWPPLVAAMRPATEARLWAELCQGRIVLRGQADLTLGQAVASGTRARKIIVDHKTGGRSPEHRHDLRFYALVDTLRTGVPPRLLVTAYLSGGVLETEPVTTGILEATVARVVDGVREKVALASGAHEPVRRPSVACRWCDLLDGCEVGRAHLEELR